MNPADDILLLKLIKTGDEHAFEYLFDIYFIPLCRYMYLYLDNPQEAEELSVDIFMYLWENREQLEIKLSLKAYLFQAARNKCLNSLRNKKHTLSIDDLSDVSQWTEESSSLEMEELARLIEEAIFSLPEKCREVFKRSREENLTNQEIADEMQISVKTVEAQITKALKRIKEFLGEQYTYLF